jgi:hypothetical protein
MSINPKSNHVGLFATKNNRAAQHDAAQLVKLALQEFCNGLDSTQNSAEDFARRRP